MISLRRSTISASAPECSDSRNVGIAVAVISNATAAADEVKVVINHAAATSWIHEPRLDSRPATQKARNAGIANGCLVPTMSIGLLPWYVLGFRESGGPPGRWSSRLECRECWKAGHGINGRLPDDRDVGVNDRDLDARRTLRAVISTCWCDQPTERKCAGGGFWDASVTPGRMPRWRVRCRVRRIR